MHVSANSALRRFSQLTGFRSAPKCKIREPKLFPKQLRLSETPIPTLFKFLFCGLRHQYHALHMARLLQIDVRFLRSFAGIYQSVFFPRNTPIFTLVRSRKQVKDLAPTYNMQRHRFADRFKTSLRGNKSEIPSPQL